MRIFKHGMLALCLTGLLACSGLGTAAPVQSPAATGTVVPSPGGGSPRPNIIFILTDDMAAADLAYMPKTSELLGGQGASFDQFFVSMSLCCPSRTSVLRGQYPHNTQILGNQLPEGGFEKFNQRGLEASTIAVWLQNAGYRTALMGKYLNGYPGTAGQKYIPPGWTKWYSPVGGNGYSEYDYTLNENGHLVQYGHRPRDYGTDVYGGKAVTFIQHSAAAGQPFFIYLAPYAPHSPSTPAPRHVGLFDDMTLPHPPSFDEKDTSDKPSDYAGAASLSDVQIQGMQLNYHLRLESLQAVDEMVAKLVSTLQATGQLDNTYLFFSSDNGYHMGQHRLTQGKNTAFEEDIRVPLLVRGPGIQPGSLIDDLAGNVDLAPTFAELAGVAPPDFIDGRSLVPLLHGKDVSWREAYLLERGATDATALALDRSVAALSSPDWMNGLLEPPDSPLDLRANPAYRGLRTADYTYVEYQTGEVELYDLHADPYELQNIASTADAPLLARLHTWLATLRNCSAISCRTADVGP